jgi:hypothetical protein
MQNGRSVLPGSEIKASDLPTADKPLLGLFQRLLTARFA